MSGVIALPLMAVVTLAGGLGLMKLGRVIGGRTLRTRHANSAINYQIHYQSTALAAALAFVALLSFINNGGFLGIGDLDARANQFGWMGFDSDVTWTTAGLTFLIVPTLATAIVSYTQVAKRSKLVGNRFVQALAWGLLFSLTNSLTEELIFRVGLAQVLGAADFASYLPWVTAAVFGGLHYFGTPGKAIGVLMAGFLGWVLMWSILETHGIAWAWAIHCAQDTPILTLIIWKSLSEATQS